MTLKKITNESFIIIRYLIVGGVVWSVDIIAFTFFVSVLAINAILANGLSKLVSFAFSFFGHRIYTFSVNERSSAKKQLFRSVFAAIFNLLFSSIILEFIIFISGNVFYSKILSDFISIVVAYYIGRVYVFKIFEQE